jgi:transcriptional regulator with XRE-family HTH domain
MNIGQRIREVREDLGMQAAVLARRVEVAPNTIYRIEAGDRTPSVALLEKIARELRTEPAELMREPVPLAEASETGPSDQGAGEEQWPKTVAEVRAKYLPAAALLGDYVRVYEKLMGTAELTASDVTASVRTAVEANDYHLMLLESEIVELGYVLGRKLTRQEQLHDLSVIQPALAHYRSLIRALVESLPASEEKNALVELASEVRG